MFYPAHAVATAAVNLCVSAHYVRKESLHQAQGPSLLSRLPGDFFAPDDIDAKNTA